MSKDKVVLVVGSGGRECAVARKFAASRHVGAVYACPGNAGTDGEGGVRNAAPGPQKGVAGIVDAAKRVQADLVFVGPEAPLVEGVADAMREAGLACFGPTLAASKLEASKAFSKAFFDRHKLPTARYRVFTELDAAVTHVRAVDYPVVIKASGLCAGKGVLIPEPGDAEGAVAALRQVMETRAFGAAGDEVVVEELLLGQECSVLAFCDGRTAVCMPAAQDHKRALDGDRGLNTGGMGAYAPAPCVTPELGREIAGIVQRTLDGLREEGTPFVGVLFAGLMLTPTNGPMLLEYNVRMGDPETEVVIPLLQSDLYEVCAACVRGALEPDAVQWHADRSAATVVVAARGYPEAHAKGLPVPGLAEAGAVEGASVYHAGTSRDASGRVVSSGGRVLAVTGVGRTLREAVDTAYRGVRCVQPDPARGDFHYRTDIAHRALGRSGGSPEKKPRAEAGAA